LIVSKKYDMPFVCGVQVHSDLSEARVHCRAYFPENTTAQLIISHQLITGAISGEQLEQFFNKEVVVSDNDQIN
jgi:hypothetical protein